MPLPDNFNPVEHFQDVVRKTHNPQVKRYFNDLGGEDIDPDISTPRSSLRTACLLDDDDTLTMSLFKYLFYHFTVRRGDEILEPVYGIPVGTYHETRKFKPQIKLIFKEDLDTVEDGFTRVEAEITFRLMNETGETLTNTKIERLARNIKNELAIGDGFKFKKGKKLCSYNDPEKGYKLQLYCYDEPEAMKVVEKVLSIQNHAPQWENFNESKNKNEKKAYPTIPPKKKIVGKNRRIPRKRPTATVRFQYATLDVWGLKKPIPLVDRVYRFLDPIESV